MIAVVGAALFYAVIGLAAIAKPQTLLKSFGLEANAPESRNEIRGVYRGFPLVVAGLLLFALTRPDVSDGILARDRGVIRRHGIWPDCLCHDRLRARPMSCDVPCTGNSRRPDDCQ
ncbi:MAG: DUF4345 family protein [Hyphomonas sp.]|uniref:DUF4345 family protein n=1 Tax=Hyphomonas sp. TaxID=87 RepID=UPI0034A07DAE